MRANAFATLAVTGLLVGITFHATPAFAGSMDPTPERFVLQPPGLPGGATCQSIAMNPETGLVGGNLPNNFPCSPDNIAFKI